MRAKHLQLCVCVGVHFVFICLSLLKNWWVASRCDVGWKFSKRQRPWENVQQIELKWLRQVMGRSRNQLQIVKGARDG